MLLFFIHSVTWDHHLKHLHIFWPNFFFNILLLNEYWKWRIWLIIRVRVVSNRWHNNAMTSYYHDIASSYRTEYRGSVVFLFSRESPRSGSSKLLYSKHCTTILYRRHDCYKYPCVDRGTEGNYEVFINFSWFLCFCTNYTHTHTCTLEHWRARKNLLLTFYLVLLSTSLGFYASLE